MRTNKERGRSCGRALRNDNAVLARSHRLFNPAPAGGKADFCDTVRKNRFSLSHVSVTCRRSPKVSSTAFDAQPPDLPPVHLMDMGFAIIGSLARHRRPPIRFLFIVSRLCSALLSGPASRRV